MRSLWRSIAARWLGGRASETLTGDGALDQLLAAEMPAPAYLVQRRSEVSHRAMLPQPECEPQQRETMVDKTPAGAIARSGR
jgi:hypothetical protein